MSKNNDFAPQPAHKKKPGRPPRITEPQISDIVASYTTCTAKELALKHKCSKRHIMLIWAKHGMKGKSRRRYAVDLNYFETIDSPDKAYFLGFIAADGCVRKPAHGPLALTIKVSSKDEEVLIKFVGRLKSDLPVSRTSYKTPWKAVAKEASFVNVISTKVCADLAKYNITERKTRTFTPARFPENLMPHYMRGFFDGDGTVYKVGAKSGNNPSDYRLAISVNSSTGLFFQNYLRRNGVKCTLVEDKGSSLFQLRISDTVSKHKFVKLIYSDPRGLYLTRKKMLADKFMMCCERLKA